MLKLNIVCCILFATIMNITSADHLEIPEDFTDGLSLPDGFFEEHESGSQEDENTVEDYDSQYQID